MYDKSNKPSELCQSDPWQRQIITGGLQRVEVHRILRVQDVGSHLGFRV